MRHSWEARCRLVRLDAGWRARRRRRRSVRREPRDGVPACRALPAGGWDALRDRPPIAQVAPGAAERRGGAADRRAARPHRLGPEAPGGRARLAGGDDLARAAPPRRLPSSGAPRLPANRYEYAAPGELVHLDIKQLGRFWQVGKRALGDGVQRNRAPAGSTCTSRSTTTRATPSRRSARRRPAPTRSRSSSTHRALRRARHPDRAGHERQRLLLRSGDFRRAVPATASDTSAPGRTRPERTAKPKRSSASCCANGHTATSGTRAPPRPRAARLPALVQHPPSPRHHGSPPISRISQAQRSYS